MKYTTCYGVGKVVDEVLLCCVVGEGCLCHEGELLPENFCGNAPLEVVYFSEGDVSF